VLALLDKARAAMPAKPPPPAKLKAVASAPAGKPAAGVLLSLFRFANKEWDVPNFAQNPSVLPPPAW